MPAFSAVGAYVAGTLLGLTGTAVTIAGVGLTVGGALVASVVAAGVAGLTSRLINGSGGGAAGGGTQQDPGVRVQLPPATDNKVPIVYGRANTKGVVTDARISSDNQVMTYVLILSEKTQTGAFTLGSVYWNDELLTFNTGSNSHKVASSRDQNGLGTTSTNLADLIEMRVYAGSATTATSQIFPTNNQVAATTYIGESTSTYQLNDLVYAVVKLTYSAEKSVTSLAQMTFEVRNEVQNPGSVLYDYLTSTRYGAGISPSEIDADSMTNLSVPTSLRSISREIPPDQFNSDGSTSTQFRYIINGVLSTGETVKNNLEKITQACASWLTYDFEQGKWTVVVNRALGSSELAACVVYDDDSIVGEITVNATNLEDLYNSIEVEFPSREIRDQNDYYRASVVKSNDLEPDNTLSLRYDLINNAIHAQRLGLIELNQSRVDKTIQFRTTYKGLQTKAGDVIKVTNEVYGFTDKLFRVTRVREVEDESGGLFAEITGLEYSAGVYGDTSITDYQPNTASGIPSFNSPTALPKPSRVTTIATDESVSANQPFFTVSTTIDPTSGPVDRVLWYYLPMGATTTNYVYITDEVGPFTAGQTVSDTITGLTSGDYDIYARTIRNGVTSAFSDIGIVTLPPVFPPAGTYSNSIQWRPKPGGVNNGTISTATFSNQVQITNTASSILRIPLVATTSGFQPVYADNDITFDAGSNLLSVGGLALSTGTVVQRTVSAGGFPLNAQGTSSIFLGVAGASLIASNVSGNLNPVVYVRAHGQNRVGGTATTAGNPILFLESSRGTNTTPTAVTVNDSLGGISAVGYDGNNWLSATMTAAPNFLGWYATETMTFDATTATITNAAGSGINWFVQPAWTRPGATASTRQRFLFSNWTTSTTAPSQFNLNIGSGTSGADTTATLTLLNGNTYVGPGRTNANFVNSIINLIGVPTQDAAPDNSTLLATNTINFVSGRRSGVSGRRNIIQGGDTIGIINFNGQTADNATGFGSQSVSITASAIETFSGSARGGQLSFRTVNSGTNTINSRMDLNDRQNAYNSDNHIFRDKSASFNAMVVTTATTTINGALNATGVYHCEVARSSDQSLTTSTDVVIQFNKTNSDPNSWYNSGTYRITPTVSGYYLVQLQVIWSQGTGTSANQNNVQIRKNGSTFAIAQESLYTGTVATTQNTFGVVQLNGSSDYIDVTGFNGGSASQSVKGSTNGEWTKVTLTKLQ